MSNGKFVLVVFCLLIGTALGVCCGNLVFVLKGFGRRSIRVNRHEIVFAGAFLGALAGILTYSII